jgi:hypothetical protein
MKIVLALIFLTFISKNSYACSCMSYDIEKADAEHEVIFIRKVIQVEKQLLVDSSFLFPYKFKTVNFEVHKHYKDLEGASFDLATPNDSAACGYYFEKGTDYVVFASHNKERWKYEVDSCSPTIL